MATVTSWVEHLTTDSDPVTEGVQIAGEIYPFVGTEVWWLIACMAIWIVWHVITSAGETEELEELASRNPGPDAHKDNITNW